MRYTNRQFTYLLTYLLTYRNATSTSCVTEARKQLTTLAGRCEVSRCACADVALTETVRSGAHNSGCETASEQLARGRHGDYSNINKLINMIRQDLKHTVHTWQMLNGLSALNSASLTIIALQMAVLRQNIRFQLRPRPDVSDQILCRISAE